MSKFLVPALVAVVTASVFVCPAHAVPRTFVSGAGNDANTCDSRSAPCRTLAGAYIKTDTGGEISVVDTGEFSQLSIQRSMTISNDGAGAAMVRSGAGSAILVSMASGVVVTLRGLDIDGDSTQNINIGGIRFLGSGELHVQNCTIRNFNGTNSAGILFQPNAASKLFVSDTNVQYNGTSTTGGGIVVAPSGSGAAIAVLTRVQSEGNSTAFKADSSGASGFVNMTIRDSSASGGSQHGVWAVGGGGGVDVFVSQSSIASNGGSGLRAEGGSARLFYSYSVITNNGLGLNPVSPGQVITNGTNQNRGNFSQGAPSSTVGLD